MKLRWRISKLVTIKDLEGIGITKKCSKEPKPGGRTGIGVLVMKMS
jgi:hypothetical protein